VWYGYSVLKTFSFKFIIIRSKLSLRWVLHHLLKLIVVDFQEFSDLFLKNYEDSNWDSEDWNISDLLNSLFLAFNALRHQLIEQCAKLWFLLESLTVLGIHFVGKFFLIICFVLFVINLFFLFHRNTKRKQSKEGLNKSKSFHLFLDILMN